MRPTKLPSSLALKLTPGQRRAVEDLAIERRSSLGEAARVLLSEAMRARGMMEE